MSVKDGRLVLPDGMSYRVLVLPEMHTMTPALLRKVKELVEAGATVIGPPPLKSPSLSGYPHCDAEVKQLAAEIWGDGVMKWWSDGKKPGGNTPSLQYSNTPLPTRHVIWDSAFKTPDGALGAENPLEQAKWIWHNEGNPAVGAPVGTRYFRRSFALEGNADIESARVFMTADNSFELWVNGRKAGKGDNFHVAAMLDAKRLLKAGKNVLAVAAENGGPTPNPAGLIGTLLIKFRDGQTLAVGTDKEWQTAESAKGKWTTETTASGEWSGAMELGPMGMAPWGSVERPNAQADVYCDFGVVAGLLGKLGVPPDFESDGPVRYTHRHTKESEIYFVANREDRAVDTSCTFRVSGDAPELWDPLTGQTRELLEFTARDGRTTVPMRFEPAQSFFVIFRKTHTKAKGLNFPPSGRAGELAGPWEVSFDPKWGGPAQTTFQTLEDWTSRPEPGIRYTTPAWRLTGRRLTCRPAGRAARSARSVGIWISVSSRTSPASASTATTWA